MLGAARIGDLDEAEATGLAGNAVAHQVDGIDGETGALKEISHVGIGPLEWEISNIKSHRTLQALDYTFL